MALRLHWSPDSANLPVRIALMRLGLAFDAARVNRAAGEQRSVAYRALNPQGLIPVLEDGGIVLFETGAILLHLADREGRLGAGGPPAADPTARAAFLRWLFWVSNTLHADLRLAFYTHRYVGEALVPTVRAGVAARLEGHLALVEGALPAQGGLVAAIPTLVEDYLAACLRWAQIYPSAAPLLPGLGAAPLPRLRALLARLEADEALQAACAAEAIPLPHPLTRPEPPALPASEVTG